MEDYQYVDLAKKFGTPLYVMDEDEIRRACREFKNAIYKNYGKNASVLYASKALSCVGIYKIINEEGLGLDAVSGGEIYTALKAGFPMEKIHFHGNNKSLDELAMAAELGVGRIVVDNDEELEKIISLNKKCSILIRICPGVDVDTHDSVKTGTSDSKFGFSFENAEKAVEKSIKNDNIKFKGFHCHIGSQIFDADSFEKSSEIMMDFIKKISSKLGITIEELNIGGGFGVNYVGDDPKNYIDDLVAGFSKKIKQKSHEFGIKEPFVYIEPGRGIVARAGVTLYTVGSVKETENKIFIAVDGSMADNPRFALYRSIYKIVNISRKENGGFPEKNLTIAGRCCESGDIIAQNLKMQIPRAGDILKVCCTGAYNFSMASNYNRLCKPAMVLVNKKETKVISRRQNYDDLISLEI
jgi:diaminopimelate decarboxylase